MNRTSAVVISLVVALGLVVGAFLVLNNNGENEESTTNQTTQQQEEQTEQQTEEEPTQNEDRVAVVIQYTDEGFEPAQTTIQAGETVKWENNSSNNMWVASNEHPAHTMNPDFDQLGSVSNGQSFSYVFDEPGEYPYHNHLSPSDGGTIIVE